MTDCDSTECKKYKKFIRILGGFVWNRVCTDAFAVMP